MINEKRKLSFSFSFLWFLTNLQSHRKLEPHDYTRGDVICNLSPNIGTCPQASLSSGTHCEMRVWVKEVEVLGLKRESNGIIDAAISAVAQICNSPPSVADLAALCQRPVLRCP